MHIKLMIVAGHLNDMINMTLASDEPFYVV